MAFDAEYEVARLVDVHSGLCKRALELLLKKNKDYSGNLQSEGGAFANIRLCETLGVAKAEQGVLIRLCDKISRLAGSLKSDLAVKDESREDTVTDIVNYAIILLVLCELRETYASEAGESKMREPISKT